nr:hypothetical protein [Tanacetum cinerariifolium]
MNFVHLFRLRINQDVVNEEDDTLVKIRLTYAVHKVHEYRRSVSQTERHNRELKMFVPRPECSFGNIFFAYSQPMIARTKMPNGKVILQHAYPRDKIYEILLHEIGVNPIDRPETRL